MAPVSIRRTEDRDLVNYLDQICFPGEPMDSGPLEWATWWIACAGKEPVAYAGLLPQEGASKAFLCRAGVIHAARGGGLQKRLVRVREAHARRSGIPRLYTYVSAWNFASMNTLIGCGFRPYYTVFQTEPANAFIYLQRHLK